MRCDVSADELEVRDKPESGHDVEGDHGRHYGSYADKIILLIESIPSRSGLRTPIVSCRIILEAI